jgi:hypothetical protein
MIAVVASSERKKEGIASSIRMDSGANENDFGRRITPLIRLK